MKFGVYAMRDRLTGFAAPTIELHDAVAIRNFSHSVLKAGSLFDSHPGDFDLYKLGSYDSDTGIITPLEIPEVLTTGHSVYLSSRDGDGDV